MGVKNNSGTKMNSVGNKFYEDKPEKGKGPSKAQAVKVANKGVGVKVKAKKKDC